MDHIMESEHIIGGRKEDKNILLSSERADLSTDRDFLKNTQVSSLFPEHRTALVTLSPNDSLADAFKTLVQNNILSAPVFDPEKQAALAFVDMLDIVCFVVSKLEVSQSLTSQSLLESSFMKDTKCMEIAGTSGRNTYYPIEEHCSLWMAMELMDQKKVHRLPVVDSNGELITIVTQSHVVDLIYKNIDKFSIAPLTLAQLQVGAKSVLSVSLEDKVIDAFKLIHSQKVSGVAVVDRDGKLVGNISASDLKMRASERFRAVEHPIPGPICALPTSTFEEVVTKIAITHAHRVYLVNEHEKPSGVISLVDILDAVLHHLSQPQQLQQQKEALKSSGRKLSFGIPKPVQ